MERNKNARRKKAHLEHGESSGSSSSSRSLASRLGMAEMSCFPTSRLRRTSNIYDVSRTSSQTGRKDHGNASSNISGNVGGSPGSNTSTMFRSLDRGKAVVTSRGGDHGRNAGTGSWNKNVLVEGGRSVDGRGTTIESRGTTTMNVDNHHGTTMSVMVDEGSSSSSDSEDVFELPSVENDRIHQTYKSPLYVERTSSRGSSSSSSSGKRKSAQVCSSRGVYAASSSAATTAAAAAAAVVPPPRRLSPSIRDVYNSGGELQEFQLEGDSASGRRLGSFMDSEVGVRGGRTRPSPTAPASRASRLTSPLRSIRNSRFRQNNDESPYSRTRRNADPSSALLSRPRAPREEVGQNTRRRNNIANCFPAFGNNTGRRSASPMVGESRRSSSGGAFSESHPAFPTLSSASSASSQGALSMLAAALGSRDAASQGDGNGTTFGWEYHRPRLMAEGLAKVLMALERMEADEELTHEQLLMLEATVLFGGMALHDEHRDWRLDVDSMSYEELLALGDRIGTVSTGLNHDVVSRRLRKVKFNAFNASSSANKDGELKCSVCQEEYVKGDELGWIDCGHKFHAGCIGQWLVQKNLCPICKATALEI